MRSKRFRWTRRCSDMLDWCANWLLCWRCGFWVSFFFAGISRLWWQLAVDRNHVWYVHTYIFRVWRIKEMRLVNGIFCILHVVIRVCFVIIIRYWSDQTLRGLYRRCGRDGAVIRINKSSYGGIYERHI